MPDQPWTWIGFAAFVLAMLALDLGLFHRKSRKVSLKEALIWTAVWIGLALAFNAGIFYRHGGEKALQFFTGYLVELSLSMDNLFVFLLIFGYFKVPAEYQHKVLFWGIIGALIMRAVFIAAGITLIVKFHWIVYLFGALLVASGIKLALQRDKGIHPERNPVLKLFRRFMQVTAEYEGDRFFVKQQGRMLASPLFVVLLLVESADLVFAVDSVPAVLAITSDPFIVFTSNVFAILGLRSMFFALEGVMQRFVYLHHGLAAVLVFVGVKMLLADYYKIPSWVSLLCIVGILAVSVIASVGSAGRRKSEVRQRMQQSGATTKGRIYHGDTETRSHGVTRRKIGERQNQRQNQKPRTAEDTEKLPGTNSGEPQPKTESTTETRRHGVTRRKIGERQSQRQNQKPRTAEDTEKLPETNSGEFK